MLGKVLEDPYYKESLEFEHEGSIDGIGLLQLKTRFLKDKKTKQIKSESIWPSFSKIEGFEIHNGETELDDTSKTSKIKPMFKKDGLGWYLHNKKGATISGTYIHGIFENDLWRNSYINQIRKSKNLPKLDKKTKSYKIKREEIINNLANEFNKHLDISSLLN